MEEDRLGYSLSSRRNGGNGGKNKGAKVELHVGGFGLFRGLSLGMYLVWWCYKSVGLKGDRELLWSKECKLIVDEEGKLELERRGP